MGDRKEDSTFGRNLSVPTQELKESRPTLGVSVKVQSNLGLGTRSKTQISLSVTYKEDLREDGGLRVRTQTCHPLKRVTRIKNN